MVVLSEELKAHLAQAVARALSRLRAAGLTNEEACLFVEEDDEEGDSLMTCAEARAMFVETGPKGAAPTASCHTSIWPNAMRKVTSFCHAERSASFARRRRIAASR